jgi:hypothetical protein
MLGLRNKSIFLLLILPSLSFSSQQGYFIDQAVKNRLFESHVWQRLLHLNQKQEPYINNKTFLLTYPAFTPKKELVETIKSFYNTPQSICKYPARYHWLKRNLEEDTFNFPTHKCKEFKQYLQKTNLDKLELVFVSENVTNPSSMMGHTFFKLTSHKNKGERKVNAVSFFTLIDTVNPLLLISKSTLTGMKGFFILSPYHKQIKRYLYEEERNIWEYELNLSKEEKKLIYYHFWELKDIDIKYLFTGFNCATIIDDMLGITDKNYNRDSNLWLTPKDVIKKAYHKKLITKMNLVPSKKWEIKMLTDALDSNRIEKIYNILHQKAFKKLKSYQFSNDSKIKALEQKLILAYIQSQYYKKEITKTQLEDIKKIIQQKSNEVKYDIDLSSYKNPIHTFNDSQLSLGYQNNNIHLKILPASNRLYDDNQEYFGETRLKIGELDLEINKKTIKLDSFELFNMKALNPIDTFNTDLSKELKVTYEKHYNQQLNPYHAYNISGAMGITKKLSNDITLFSMLGGGLAYGDSELYPYIYPEFGMMIYEIFNMKSTLEYQYIYNQSNTHQAYHNIHFEHSLFLDKQVRLGFGVDRKKNHHYVENDYSFSFNWFF